MPDIDTKAINELQKSLDEIKGLFILANRENLDAQKLKLLPKGSMKERVYDLCDGSKTTIEMAKILGKDENYVRSYLSILRKDGLIRSVDKEGKVYPEQII